MPVAHDQTDYINDRGDVKALIYNAKSKLLWMGIKDNTGRIGVKYAGYEFDNKKTGKTEFRWMWVSKINYDWPDEFMNYGALGTAYNSKTYFYQRQINFEALSQKVLKQRQKELSQKKTHGLFQVK